MPAPTYDPDTLGFLFGDIARMFRAQIDLRIADAGFGLTAGEARTLVQAARLGEVRQNVLAERMGVEAMTVSSYLDRLEAQGFIERIADPDDRRAKLVRLTDSSVEALERMRGIGLGLRADTLHTLTPENHALLIDMLKTIRSNLHALSATPDRKPREPQS